MSQKSTPPRSDSAKTLVESPAESGGISDLLLGAAYFFVLQLVARIGTFSLNQYLLVLMAPQIFGLANVQMELFVSCVLFFSREAIRSALLRSTPDNGKNTDGQSPVLQRMVNMSFLPAVLGLLITPSLMLYYVYILPIPDVEHYYVSLCIYACGTYFELLIEPLYIVSLSLLYLRLRVAAEAVATLAACAVTSILTKMGEGETPQDNRWGLLAFAWGRMAFGVMYVLVYASFFTIQTIKRMKAASTTTTTAAALSAYSKGLDLFKMVPRPLVGKSGMDRYFDPQLMKLSMSFARQSVLKQLLTEGDKILLSSVSTPSDQGVYAFVINYGSLVVRIIFFPLEDTGRMIFARLLTSEAVTLADGKKLPTSAMSLKRHSDLSKSRNILALAIQFHVLLGMLFICFGTNYTYEFIDLLAGKYWANETVAPAVLAFYCVYVPIMGVNGITEAFVTSVANDQDLKRQNYAMVGFSFLFVITGVVSVKFLAAGAFGIIFANMVNLSARIQWSCAFINRFFSEQQLHHQQQEINHGSKLLSLTKSNLQLTFTEFIPKMPILLTFGLSWIVTAICRILINVQTISGKIKHICCGLVMFTLCLSVVYKYERRMWIELRGLAAKQKSKAE